MTNVGMIPENFSFTDVYNFHVASLPTLLVARRASADELIWDAEGGFTDQWFERSSYEGNPTDGYDFHIARRAFSVAGVPIFASGSASGGGSVTLSGEVSGPSDETVVDAIQGHTVVFTSPTNGQLVAFGPEGDLVNVDAPEGDVTQEYVDDQDAATLQDAKDYTDAAVAGISTPGSDDVVNESGVTGSSVSDALDGHETRIDALEAASGPVSELYRGYNNYGDSVFSSTTWAGAISAFGAWVDEIQDGVTRSSSTFTVTTGGRYLVGAWFNAYATESQYFAIRITSGGVTRVQEMRYGNVADVSLAFNAVIELDPGATFTIQYARTTGANIGYGGGAITLDGEQMRTGTISIIRVGA